MPVFDNDCNCYMVTTTDIFYYLCDNGKQSRIGMHWSKSGTTHS